MSEFEFLRWMMFSGVVLNFIWTICLFNECRKRSLICCEKLRWDIRATIGVVAEQAFKLAREVNGIVHGYTDDDDEDDEQNKAISLPVKIEQLAERVTQLEDAVTKPAPPKIRDLGPVPPWIMRKDPDCLPLKATYTGTGENSVPAGPKIDAGE